VLPGPIDAQDRIEDVVDDGWLVPADDSWLTVEPTRMRRRSLH